MPENQIHLIVQTLSGTFADDFNVHQKLKHVVEKTFQALHIVPSPNDVWELRYNDTVLDQNLSIQDAHLPNNAQLTLAPREGGGGISWISR